MHRLRELRGVRSPTTTSIPLQTSDYRALRQKDIDLEEDDDKDAASSNTPPDHSPSPQLGHTIPITRLSTLASVAATPWIVHILLVLLYVFTFLYLLQKTPSDATCIAKLSMWSPAIDAGVVRYKTIPLAQKNNQYNGLSSAEVDAAWTNITSAVPKLWISAAELRSLRKKPTENEVYKDQLGYAAQLGVYELLGCLDRLRKAYNKEDKGTKDTASSINSDDSNHEDLVQCIDILRVELMCSSDVDLVTYKEEGNGLRADFSGVKKCRGFDDILEWSFATGKIFNLSTASQTSKG